MSNKRWNGRNHDKVLAQKKRYYIKHRAEILAKYNARRKIISSIIAGAKSQPCMDCHRSFPVCAMDFDHVRGDKKFDVAHMQRLAARSNYIAKLLEEIAKCDVVCSNCHRVRTHGTSRISDDENI